ncbi:MAG: hypothetical protein GX491_00240 [Chloroflexi bacterium]|nr:hypothetical protein [Chloroflexota bacterium]
MNPCVDRLINLIPSFAAAVFLQAANSLGRETYLHPDPRRRVPFDP